jgi:K+-sensing histidine kinase KdpD
MTLAAARSPFGAFALGTAGVVTVLAALMPFNDELDLSVPALLLLVPIAATSALAGWRAATPLAVVAGLGYSLGYVPPIGDIRPHVWRDAITLITFVTVALAVGVLAERGRAARNEQLLDARRAELLRTVGHDLRNPLHMIQAMAADLLAAARDDSSRRSLATMAAESERLDRIVANMLSASRIEAGALLPERAPEHLPALVAAAVRRLPEPVQRRVDVEIPESAPDVSVDAVQFDQVLVNLLENAARHGAGRIAVTAIASPSTVEVTVADDGPGFAPDQLVGPTPFQPGPASSGTGLGLSVCAGIVGAHGGQMRVANRAAGGAAVSVSWPLAD